MQVFTTTWAKQKRARPLVIISSQKLSFKMLVSRPFLSL